MGGSLEVKVGAVISGTQGLVAMDDFDVAPGAVVKVHPGALIEVHGDAGNTSTAGAGFVRTDGRVIGLDPGSKFNMKGTAQSYEAAGGDYGDGGSGYVMNFALGDLQILTGTTTLADAVDNDTRTPGAEAVYVDTLRIADGATLVLGSSNLYYHTLDSSAGWGGTLDDSGSGAAMFSNGPADFDGNTNVGLGDFSLFAGAFGKTEGEVGFDEKFDLDHNNAVGLGDFSLFAGLYGTTFNYGGPMAPVPEPATLTAIAAGVVSLVVMNRRTGV
jgi:hypothetical protein